MSERILVVGRKSWLGNRYYRELDDPTFYCDSYIVNLNQFKTHVAAIEPTVIINCIGKTGRPNIDWCETHKEETLESNVSAACMVADTCKSFGIKMVHLSSGCIYSGYGDHGGWVETDEPCPNSFYGETKARAEREIEKIWHNILILRIRIPIDTHPHPRNLIDKLVSYKKVIHKPNSVTVVTDLINATEALLTANKKGIFHVVNPGLIYHDDILKLYKKYVNPRHEYEVIENNDEMSKLYKTGRSNCKLNTDKLGKVIELPYIDGRMEWVMKMYAKYASQERAFLAHA